MEGGEGGLLCNEEIIEPPELYPKPGRNTTHPQMDNRRNRSPGDGRAYCPHALTLITAAPAAPGDRPLINLQSSVDLGGHLGGVGVF